MIYKYLVSGATGLLGNEFINLIESKDLSYQKLKRADLDFSDNLSTLTTIIKNSKCNVLIHCAANTNVEECENNIDNCYKINYLLPEILASICNKMNIKFVFISSTGVYGTAKDGAYTELDQPVPTTHHHKAKHKAEIAALAHCSNSLIIRTGWLFGGSPRLNKNFVANRLQEAKNSDGVIYSDTLQKGNPSYSVDVVKRILLLIENDICGIYNCINEGVASRYEYVSKIIELCHVNVSVAEFNGVFKRIAKVSHNESAINYKMDLLGYPKMRSWQIALGDYIEENKL